MKKGYLTKVICFVLVCVMLVPLFSFEAGAFMKGFNVKRADKFRERQVEITIDDMKFMGTLSNSALTEKEFEKIVRELMKDLGMEEGDFAKLNGQMEKMLENMGFSKADMDKIISNIFDVAGGALGGFGGAIGTVADVLTALQSLWEIINGKYGDAATTVGEAIATKSGDVATDSSKGGKGYGWAKAGKVFADEWTKDQKKYREMRDGLEATRKLNSFYNLLDSRIEQFCDKNRDKNVLKCLDAKAAPKTFTLYGTEYTETWKLNMNLKYKKKLTANPNINDGIYAGVYEGDFNIDIEYDVGQLPHHIREMGELGQRYRQYLERSLGQLSIDVVSGSKWKRAINGTAEASVNVTGGNSKIDFKKQGDEKSGTLVAEYFGERNVGYGGGTATINIGFSPGDEKIILDFNSKATIYTNDGYYNNPTNSTAGSVPIEGDIWKRGDNLNPATLKVIPWR